jgi:hypothetical protein
MMDRNRNEDILPEDTALSGMGDERERTAGKQDSGRTNSDIERGRDAMAGRAGEGNARPGNEDRDAIPSDEL